MAGVFRKTMVYLGLMEPSEDAYSDEEPVDGEEDEAQVRPLARSGYSARGPADDTESYGSLAVRTRSRSTAEAGEEALPSSPYRIATLVPVSYDDAKQIGRQFREQVPVIMNLSELDTDLAKRLVDFAAGLVFGLHGRLERVTPKVFLLSPHNVEVTAEVEARIREGGFFNQS